MERHSLTELSRLVRLRLTRFCDVVEVERSAFRALMLRVLTPFDPAPSAGRVQRDYGAPEVLAWFLLDRLRQVGMPYDAAAAGVRLSGAAEAFLAAPADAQREMHLLVWRETVHRTRPYPGDVHVHRQRVGTPADVAEVLAGAAARMGEPQLRATEPRDEGRSFGGVRWMVAVPVRPCFELARARLAAHGLEIHGLQLRETPPNE